jgi:hypothetical protein
MGLRYPHRPSLPFPRVVLYLATLELTFPVVGAVVRMVAVRVARIGFLRLLSGTLRNERGGGGAVH